MGGDVKSEDDKEPYLPLMSSSLQDVSYAHDDLDLAPGEKVASNF